MRTGFVKVEKGAFGSKEIPEDQLPVHLEYGWTLVSAEPPTPKEVLHVVAESAPVSAPFVARSGYAAITTTDGVDYVTTTTSSASLQGKQRKPKKSDK